jgi:hypothetical protein
LKFFRENVINELVATSNKFTNNFVGMVISGLGPDVTAGRQFDYSALGKWVVS